MTKRHFEKIKELCTVLDKISEENTNLINDNDSKNKLIKQLIESKSNKLESKLEELDQQLNSKLNKFIEEGYNSRDSELTLALKQIPAVIKNANLDKES